MKKQLENVITLTAAALLCACLAGCGAEKTEAAAEPAAPERTAAVAAIPAPETEPPAEAPAEEPVPSPAASPEDAPGELGALLAELDPGELCRFNLCDMDGDGEEELFLVAVKPGVLEMHIIASPESAPRVIYSRQLPESEGASASFFESSLDGERFIAACHSSGQTVEGSSEGSWYWLTTNDMELIDPESGDVAHGYVIREYADSIATAELDEESADVFAAIDFWDFMVPIVSTAGIYEPDRFDGGGMSLDELIDAMG